MKSTKPGHAYEPCIGDTLVGTGTHKVTVRVMAVSVDGKQAYCRLVKSGRDKWIAVATLRTAYEPEALL